MLIDAVTVMCDTKKEPGVIIYFIFVLEKWLKPVIDYQNSLKMTLPVKFLIYEYVNMFNFYMFKVQYVTIMKLFAFIYHFLSLMSEWILI